MAGEDARPTWEAQAKACGYRDSGPSARPLFEEPLPFLPPGTQELQSLAQIWSHIDLAHPLVRQDNLAHGRVTRGELPHAHGYRSGKLRQDQQPGHELSDAQEKTDAELGHGDQTHGKLADGDNPFGDPAPAAAIPAEGHMHQGITPNGAG
jgi:hypothetical protein